MSAPSPRKKTTAARRREAAQPTPEAPIEPPVEQVPASQGGMNLQKIIARYESTIGSLTTKNIMLEEQLEGVLTELNEMKMQLDAVVAQLPKGDKVRPIKSTSRAKKAAGPGPEQSTSA